MQEKFAGKSVQLWAPGKDGHVIYVPSFHVSFQVTPAVLL
jgi:hypothetical protein